MRGGSVVRRGRGSRRLLAPLAGAALLAVAALERLRRRRRDEAGDGRSSDTEANKRISRRLVEDVFNNARYDVIDEVVATSYVIHDPSAPEDLRGPQGIRRLIETYRSGFPDVRVAIEEQLAEGDLVVSRWSARGTHRGTFLGIDATGKEASVTGITIDRIVNGKIEESWTIWDTLGLLQQLGAVAEMAQA